ncbi:hypothetical protein [uncultured Paracoccus sp.]|uniref:hypothetical protein n=1 Tax=uncultured Paracoccus sp. TaxID=189685 RepID=UPI002628524D|nr:hypothetical protein [uncultured Paracoccus sp.]
MNYHHRLRRPTTAALFQMLYTRLSAILRMLKKSSKHVDLDALAAALEAGPPEQMRWAKVLLKANPR